MKLKDQIVNLLLATQRQGIENLLVWMEESGYYEAPASRNTHSSIPGGLALHSCKVLNILSDRVEHSGLTTCWDEPTITICSLLHDVCKVDMYKRAGAFYSIEDSYPIGHGEKSVILLLRFLELSIFETLAIRWHMGIPETYTERQQFSQATKLCPHIILLHLADMEAAIIHET